MAEQQLPQQNYPEFDTIGLPVNEGPEPDVRDTWPAGQIAPQAQSPEQNKQGEEQ